LNEGRTREWAEPLGPAEALVALAQLVVASADRDRLAREAARATAMALRADLCEVLRLSCDGDWLLRAASSDRGTGRVDPVEIPSGVSSVGGYALLCGAPVFSADLAHERRFGAAGAPPWEGAVSAAAAPIPGREGPSGALVVYAKREGAFGPQHALAVGRTASLLGGALRRLEEVERLRGRAEAERHSGGPGEEARGPTSGHHAPELTARQLEVLHLMSDGRSAKRIASELCLSIHTVHFHQRNLYRALGVGSSTAAVKRAAELGLLRPQDPRPAGR
jgi:DNA-binding CsgD family transcriptional regulator